MQKKLIVLALTGLASTAAFSDVTVYGRVDYGYEVRNGNNGKSTERETKREFASGIQAGSRLGVKGSDDLGGGVKAIFEIESGVSNDASSTSAGTSGLFTANRHSYVGVTGPFGTAVGGRLDGVRYGLFNKYDVFAGGGMGNFAQMTQQVDRANNAIAYISPDMGGLSLTLAYGTAITGQEAAGNVGDVGLMTAMGSFNKGPLSVSLDWEQLKAKKTEGKATVVVVGGSFDLGVVKVGALVDSHKSDIGSSGTYSVDYRDAFISLSVPVGKATIKATGGRIDDKTSANKDATKIGVGVNYALSKQTGVYLDYGKITNKNNGAYEINPSANSNGAGYGVKGFDLGMAVKF